MFGFTAGEEEASSVGGAARIEAITARNSDEKDLHHRAPDALVEIDRQLVVHLAPPRAAPQRDAVERRPDKTELDDQVDCRGDVRRRDTGHPQRAMRRGIPELRGPQRPIVAEQGGDVLDLPQLLEEADVGGAIP